MKKLAAVFLSAALICGFALSATQTIFAEDNTDTTEQSETSANTEASTISNDTDTKTFKDSDGNIYSYVENKKDDSYYNGSSEDLYKKNTVRISEFSGKSDEDIKIPDEIDGKEVTAIGDNAFADATATSLTIPKTVDIIGSSVFAGMKKCKEFKVEKGNKNFKSDDGVLYSEDGTVIYAYPIAKSGSEYKIADGVSVIGSSAFVYSKLETVSIPVSVTVIGNWAFGYSGIKEANIPSSVTTINDYAFAYCDNLDKVRLPASLTTIGAAAFADCKKITKIKLPEQLSTIGQYAFAGTGLTSVYVPASVQRINYCAFGYTENSQGTDFEAEKDFTIYGPSGGAGESYAKDEDEENDYKNDFKFVSDESTSETDIQKGDTSESLNWRLIVSVVLGGVIVIAIIAVITVIAVKNVGKEKKKK